MNDTVAIPRMTVEQLARKMCEASHRDPDTVSACLGGFELRWEGMRFEAERLGRSLDILQDDAQADGVVPDDAGPLANLLIWRRKGVRVAALDGNYSAAELRVIVAHMERGHDG